MCFHTVIFTCESVCFLRFDLDSVWASSDCSWQVILELSTDDTGFLTSVTFVERKSKRVGILLSTPDGYSPIVMETGRCLPASWSSLHVNWLVSLNRDWNQAMYNLYGETHHSPSDFMKNILYVNSSVTLSV